MPPSIPFSLLLCWTMFPTLPTRVCRCAIDASPGDSCCMRSTSSRRILGGQMLLPVPFYSTVRLAHPRSLVSPLSASSLLSWWRSSLHLCSTRLLADPDI
ncbi:hypothetical protein DFH06DRAFT_1223607 [Mycena polygramma]|nr:hypothetical protein DFH06DRAFT_1223607 [Mycena polygramma]